MSEEKQMPKWLKVKRARFILPTDDAPINLINDSISFGFDQCFEILWPQIEAMKEALVWNAHTIVLENIYDEESNYVNVCNLVRCVREAKEALIKVEAMK